MNKKVLLVAVAAVAGYLGYKRVQADKAEQDLWAEATDPVPPSDLR
ncbi:MAG TPA: DLW-39 family protein [Jiangellales bacterium]|nr:DLW-39 family protein [Jiangellales bacterium]